ncbi:hypothetical protein KFK09_010980 [Dendrobium nobile]|uniref:RNase H type-1 domain-containing protein n=1 Tax=Dendrobium nobile TaxID=94219 RepID=A0A8T3BBE7_DENNO|nr:hypothetical protein KFK09_010980 [Dendrobium nobile]
MVEHRVSSGSPTEVRASSGSLVEHRASSDGLVEVWASGWPFQHRRLAAELPLAASRSSVAALISTFLLESASFPFPSILLSEFYGGSSRSFKTLELHSRDYLSSGHWGVNQSRRLCNCWHPPPPDWIKVNVDASLLPSYKTVIGGVLRDSKGKFLMAFGKKYVHWDISQPELSSIHLIRGVNFG